jgi:hypothetical protein
LIGEQRQQQDREHQDGDHEPAILRDRENGLIGLIRGLELSGFAVEHGSPIYFAHDLVRPAFARRSIKPK